ncbi:hypothetical protein C8R46DRAFT_1027666 [Mycena filopes]|nr:hypothetical protein C8R46DRAFT_1027666 [Mycena filopes]
MSRHKANVGVEWMPELSVSCVEIRKQLKVQWNAVQTSVESNQPSTKTTIMIVAVDVHLQHLNQNGTGREPDGVLECNPEHDIVGEIKTIAHKAQIVRLIQGINEKVPGTNISAKGSKKEVMKSLTERLEEWREARDGFGWEAAWTVYEIGGVGLENEYEDPRGCCDRSLGGKLGDGELNVKYIERDGDSMNLPGSDYFERYHLSEGRAEDFTFWLVVQPEPRPSTGRIFGPVYDDSAIARGPSRRGYRLSVTASKLCWVAKARAIAKPW